MSVLSAKRAMVCGSTRGIGRATAETLADNGATVTLVARDKEMLREVCSGLGGDGHDFIVADFDNPDQLRDDVLKHTSATGPYHILVNNSGGPKGGPIIDATADEFITAFARHLLCNHILAQALVPGMKECSYGRIINIISTSVKQPIVGLGVSNTIRGAVASWAKTLSAELGEFGITVNNVLPGFTSTDRLESIITAKAKAASRTTAEIAKAMKDTIPAGRFATPEETAAAVLFLASPNSGYVSGTSIPVDGGRISAL
jgi:3-oxoacyl-[acyl-carrier protein] reductase